MRGMVRGMGALHITTTYLPHLLLLGTITRASKCIAKAVCVCVNERHLLYGLLIMIQGFSFLPHGFPPLTFVFLDLLLIMEMRDGWK